MGQNFKTPTPKLHVRVIVRDKNGKIRCDDPSKLKEFFKADEIRKERGLPPRFSIDDIAYLKEQYGDDICNL